MADIREALVALLHNEGDGGIWEHFDRKNSEAVADAILAAFDVTPRGVHNHDIDPACPETRLPDGSLRGECTTNASPPTTSRGGPSMAEYTPTTDEVRERFIDGAINLAEVTGFLATLYVTDKARADFDRWLAEVRREVWDEVADYLDRTNAPSLAEAARRDNPYRSEQP